MSATFLNYTKEPVHTFTGAVDGELSELTVHRCTDFGSHFLIFKGTDCVAMAACRGVGAPVVISVERSYDVPYGPVIYGIRNFWNDGRS